MGEQVVFKKNTFLIKIVGKNSQNSVSLSSNAISNSLVTNKMEMVCFRKVPKTTHCDAICCCIGIRYFGTTGSVELDITFFATSYLNGTCCFPERNAQMSITRLHEHV